MITTELIASKKLLDVKSKSGAMVEKYLITTKSGAEVWCNKSQLEADAETITFEFQPKGTKYFDKATATEKESPSDRNEFKGCGKQIVQKFSSKDMLEFVISKGITPAFNL